MGMIAKDHPELRAAFNFTPVLVEQLDHYASNEPLQDRVLEVILKPAEDLSEVELGVVLDHVFKLNPRTMIDPFPRYRELFGLLGGSTSPQRSKITPQDVRDLQVLYLLTWCGTALRHDDPVRSLVEKTREFTESEKEALFATMQRAVRETLPLYRDLEAAGQVEMTTTPYYHPILPLVINTSSAVESRPSVDLEGIDFRYPQDALWHVTEARKSHRDHFDRDPTGLWPAEGSVSDAALEMIASSGFRWAGADEGVLHRSLSKASLTADEKFLPYRFRDTDLWIYFRDRQLSDRIGFVYSGWDPEEAVEDLVGHLLTIRSNTTTRSGGCVTLILDGENPWEYYPDSGLGFLNGFYAKLVSMPELEPVRFCDDRETRDDVSSLGHVVPGSWIDSNFDTWIGGREKNHAWKVLSAARGALERKAPNTEVPRALYRAESSDWFWWLGPGHDTPYESSYENIFRFNLGDALEQASVNPPDLLETSVTPVATPLFRPPTHLSTPTIDGRPASYYDWIAAGFQQASEGSFHRVTRHLDRVRFGFDLDNLYLRVEGDLEKLKSDSDVRLVVTFQRPPGEYRLEYGRQQVSTSTNDGSNEFRGKLAHEVFVEMAIPFDETGADIGDPIEFAVSIVVDAVSAVGGEREIDRIPQAGNIVTVRPGHDYGLDNWSA